MNMANKVTLGLFWGRMALSRMVLGLLLLSAGDVCGMGRGTRVSPAEGVEANQRPKKVRMAKSSSWLHNDSPEAKLLKAAHNGSINDVERLLYWNRNINVDVTDEHGTTPLLWASKNGHTLIVRMLLDKRANVHIKDESGNTALKIAARQGYTDIVLMLLTYRADVHATDKYGSTALIWAAQYGHTETVKALLEWGANVHATDKYGSTALIRAVLEGHTDIVLLLDEWSEVIPPLSYLFSTSGPRFSLFLL